MKIAFLGGLNQIGKNITVFECNNDIIIVDCGMAFPDGEMLGIDFVIPDFSYLEANRDKIKGLVVTHGHEDHIGAIPYLLKKINVPIYATPLTIGLITGKLKEHRLLGSANLNTVTVGNRVRLGCMDVEFINVNHSIPDAAGLAIHSPAGTIVHTGDFVDSGKNFNQWNWALNTASDSLLKTALMPTTGNHETNYDHATVNNFLLSNQPIHKQANLFPLYLNDDHNSFIYILYVFW